MSREMKDSGVAWIGEIPVDWKAFRLKSCFESRVGGAWGSEPTGEDGDIICLRIADFDYESFVFKNTDVSALTQRHYDATTIANLKLQKNDILVEKSGGGEKTPVGRTVIFDKDYDALYANFMDRLRCRDCVSARFMQYILVTFYKNGYTRNYIKQTTGIQNLDLTAMMSKEHLFIPERSTQHRIADYLDDKCAKIDAIIARQQEIIEKLKEYKLSVITEAVTKGLNPDVPMKDSGVEFLGEIPEHWSVMTFGRCASVASCLADPIDYLDLPQISPDSIEKDSGRILSYKTVQESGVISWNHLFHEGQIIYSKIRPLLNKVTIAPYDGMCSADMYPIDTAEDKRFVLYMMLSRYFNAQVGLVTENRVKMPKINQNELCSIIVVLPSAPEQKCISIYLDQRCASVDAQIDKRQTLISKLTEYKKSLIYECVTGKREVS